MLENIIDKKNKGLELTYDEINTIVLDYLNEKIDDDNMGLFLQTIVNEGMSDLETFYLTKSMLESGHALDLSGIDGIKIDKHSTGGVGDKVTLIVAPLAASLGVKVAKMSGRSLGYTGGTIDKLESIPNLKTDLNSSEFINQVNRIGVAICSASKDLVPADKKIYSLRDTKNLVSSIPLIAASIMSKKIASSADKIVIDVKVGDGALLNSLEESKKLAHLMVEIGKKYNRETVCILTNMDEPLGNYIGNKLEVMEVIETLLGKGPNDLYEISLTVASLMVSLGLNIDYNKAYLLAKENINNNLAYQKFLELIHCQKGNLYLINSLEKRSICSKEEGYINKIKTKELGEYLRFLGTGRINKEDVINYDVGLILNAKVGDYVKKGDKLCDIHAIKYDENKIRDLFVISENYVKPKPLIYEVIK